MVPVAVHITPRGLEGTTAANSYGVLQHRLLQLWRLGRRRRAVRGAVVGATVATANANAAVASANARAAAANANAAASYATYNMSKGYHRGRRCFDKAISPFSVLIFLG